MLACGEGKNREDGGRLVIDDVKRRRKLIWVIELLDSTVSERWNLVGEHFPDAVQIVDCFHAKQPDSALPMRSSGDPVTIPHG